MNYNATATLGCQFAKMNESEMDAILDALAEFHASVGADEAGVGEVVITYPADSLSQAVQMGMALLSRYRPVGIEVIATEAWDRRLGLEPMPDLLSVSQVADRLRVTRQAVLQRIDAGTLPARRVGSVWVIPAGAAA